MSQFFQQLTALLTTPPGNIIYHFVLVFSIAGALYKAIYLLINDRCTRFQRMVFGLSILLFFQIVLFVASALASRGWLDSKAVLPPLDRMVTLLSLVWIIWLWGFPESRLLVDFSAVLLSLLAVALFGLTLAFWAVNPGTSFNITIYEIIWQVFSLAVILLGTLLLVLRKLRGWKIGLVMLLLAFIGHCFSLFWRIAGDFSGFVRVTQLIMFPFLLTITQHTSSLVENRVSVVKREHLKKERNIRLKSGRKPDKEPVAQPSIKRATSPEKSGEDRRRYSTDPKALHALLSLAAEDKSDKIGWAMTRSIAQAMLADMCFLLNISKDKSLSLTCGYDLIREEDLEGKEIDNDSIPRLANAIQHGRPLRLSANSNAIDLKNLARMLDLTTPGSLLSVPIISQVHEPLGSILILSPYSNRLWSTEDQAYLYDVSSFFVPILERAQRTSILENELDQANQQTRSVRQQITEVQKKYEEAAQELKHVDEKVSQAQLQTESMAALLAMKEESQKTIETLKNQIEQMRQSQETSNLPAASTQLEGELRQTLEEMARMQNGLAEANAKILELEQRPAAPAITDQAEIIASISQELRQPMSSIVGYTDLLQGESVGSLGPLQRKFIERIKTATERLGGLVDDLIQMTNLETGKMEFKAELTDLNLIIDNAMAYTSMQIREKNITLRLDIPDAAMRIRTDRDALQQIFIHLLQNATAADQAEGVITLRVQLQSESNKHYISIQVTDTGGGISPDDIPHVFTRRYRTENSIIQGLGDTSVGLSIAKSIVEAQGGRIWVDTEAGSGSTFSVLLPVLLESEEENKNA
jgi:signal transduction histidine kinase